MTEAGKKFERVILGVGPYLSADPAMLRYVARFAKLLAADLHGLIIEDRRLVSAAGFPAMRIFRSLQDQWQQLDPEALERSLERRTAAIRKEIASIAKMAGVAARVEGLPVTMDALLADARKGDIIVVAEPAMPADSVIHPLEELAYEALNSQAAVLFVPHPIARSRGTILTFASSPEDPVINGAAMIAAMVKEPVECNIIGGEALTPPDPRASWGLSPECLIVMARSFERPAAPLAIARKRRVPVLVLDGTKQRAA